MRTRLPTEELFHVTPGRDPLQPIGDETLTLRIDAAERARIARQSEAGYAEAVREELLHMPESV